MAIAEQRLAGSKMKCNTVECLVERLTQNGVALHFRTGPTSGVDHDILLSNLHPEDKAAWLNMLIH